LHNPSREVLPVSGLSASNFSLRGIRRAAGRWAAQGQIRQDNSASLGGTLGRLLGQSGCLWGITWKGDLKNYGHLFCNGVFYES